MLFLPALILIIASISFSGLSFREVKSEAGILISCDTGEALWKKNTDKKMYPASLTKIMTAAVILKDKPDLSEQIVIPEEIFPELYRQDAATAGFMPEETASLEDLLYGMMLPSGAECAVALAVWHSGSEKDFSEKMNLLARELGMWDSNFTNSTGLYEDEQCSTAGDLARLFRYALTLPELRGIITSERYSVNPTNAHPAGFTVYHSLKRTDEIEFPDGRILGGKTGFTNEAGLCLASLAENNYGEEYFLITLNAPGNDSSAVSHIDDAKRIYQKYFKK